ncbi:MAG: hypothetical protein WCG67_08915 [Ferruginibacter sp.]
MNKFNNNRWLPIISILLLIANAVSLTILWSQNNMHQHDETAALPRPMGPTGEVFEFISNRLKLSEQQQDAYKILRMEYHAAQQVLQDSIRKSKDAFFELLKLPFINDSILQVASNKDLGYQQQLGILTFKHFQKLRELCNSDQQKAFDTIIMQVLLQLNGPRMRLGPPPLALGRDSGKIQSSIGTEEKMDQRPPPPFRGFRREGPPPNGDRDMPPPPGEGRRRGDGPPPRRDGGMPPPVK